MNHLTENKDSIHSTRIKPEPSPSPKVQILKGLEAMVHHHLGTDHIEISFDSMSEETRETQLRHLWGLEAEKFQYIGVPILDVRGLRQGTLSVFVEVGHNVDEYDLDSLILISRQASYVHEQFQSMDDYAQKQIEKLSGVLTLGEMASGVAHEINNPLNLISSCTEALCRELKKENQGNPQIQRFVKTIERSVFRMSDMVQGLCKLARGEAQEELKEVSFHEVLRDAVNISQERFKSHGVELKKQEFDDRHILCHPVQLSQVITNLLNNAFQAAKEGPENPGQVTLSVEELKEETTPTPTPDGNSKNTNQSQTLRFLVHVEDSGPGVPPQLQDKIMKPFFTTKPQGEGTGLGLSLSSQLMEKMGGRLFFNPTRSASCFTIELTSVALKADGSVS